MSLQAECCSDQIHCCPEGTTCDLSEGVCHRQRMKIALFKKISSTKISEKVSLNNIYVIIL